MRPLPSRWHRGAYCSFGSGSSQAFRVGDRARLGLTELEDARVVWNSVTTACSLQQLGHTLLATALGLAMVLGDPTLSQAAPMLGETPGTTRLMAIADLDTPLSALQQQERTIGDLFERVTPSVVQVTQFSARTNPYTLNEVEVPVGTGSGFIWDREGHVVTNFHVIRGADAATVAITDSGGKTSSFDAALVGYNPDKDVAVLKIKVGAAGEALRPVELGESAALRVGQTTLAIGNPFGLDHTLTVGVVSGLGREMTAPSGRPISNVIQTDAAINPGNSGGALLDSRGKLIGMNTAIYSPSGTSAGIGFAVPVDTLKQQVEAILAGGMAPRASIGISYAQGQQARALARLLEGQLGVPRGVVVMGVQPNSGAARAGLKGTTRLPNGAVGLGDIIVRFDERPVADEQDLLRALDGRKPGETVRLAVVRAGEGGELRQVEIPLKLQAEAP